MSAASCTYCKRWSRNAVTIGHVEAGSGPGWAQYACPECARAHRDRPVDGERQDDGPDVGARRVLDDLPAYMPGGLLAAFGLWGRRTAVAVLASVAWLLPAWPAAQPEVSASLGSSAGTPDADDTAV